MKKRLELVLLAVLALMVVSCSTDKVEAAPGNAFLVSQGGVPLIDGDEISSLSNITIYLRVESWETMSLPSAEGVEFTFPTELPEGCFADSGELSCGELEEGEDRLITVLGKIIAAEGESLMLAVLFNDGYETSHYHQLNLAVVAEIVYNIYLPVIER